MEKIKSFFVSPSKIFKEYKENPKFVLNFIIIAVITFISYMITYIATKDQLRDIATKAAERSAHGNQQAIDMAVNMTTSPVIKVISGIFSSGFTIGIIALMAFIYWVLVKMFKGTINYLQVIAVYALSYITISIGGLCKSIYTLIFGEKISAQHVSYLKSLFAYLDLFKLWQIALLVIGLTVVAHNISKKKAIGMVVILTVIGILFVLGGVAFTNLISTFSNNMTNV